MQNKCEIISGYFVGKYFISGYETPGEKNFLTIRKNGRAVFLSADSMDKIWDEYYYEDSRRDNLGSFPGVDTEEHHAG